MKRIITILMVFTLLNSTCAFVTLQNAMVKYTKSPLPNEVTDYQSLSSYINGFEYDYEKANLLTSGVKTYDTDVNYPYQTLMEGKGICSDFALLNYVLLKKMGYEVKIIAFEHQKGGWHPVAIFKVNDTWKVIEHKTGIFDYDWYVKQNVVDGYVYTNDDYYSAKPLSMFKGE
jgi:Transglutaminase-like domain.